jgi:parvulin-like peptidyl-prolyl isomerase
LRYGDPTLLPHRLEATPAAELSRMFGVAFLKELDALAPRQWLGPIRSGYGWHLVFVIERTDGGTAGLGKNRDLVRREWEHAQRVTASERFYQALLRRYTVTIEETKFAQAASQGTR